MDPRMLAEADRVVASLSPGKRESVREIVVNTTSHGTLSEDARRFLDQVTGSPLVSGVLAAAVAGASRADQIEVGSSQSLMSGSEHPGSDVLLTVET